MSAMKPDAWMISDPDGELATAVTLRPQNPISETGLVIDGLYTLATVRKWLEPTDEMVTAGVNALKADGWGLDTEELTESMRFVCRAMLAAKLRELEDGE